MRDRLVQRRGWRILLLAGGWALAGGCALPAGGRPGRGLPADAGVPGNWRTHAERTDYAETGPYAEAVEFCRRLAAAAPEARYATFGTSGLGRPLPLLIVSRERAFTPAAARRSRRPLVLIQNCIHAGECAGKDATLALAREMLVTGERAALLDAANLLILPIFNVDGHERRGPYNRANQNGPRETGWRTTAVNLNLNRDYMKADAVEMQAWLRLWTAWQPDLLVDCHTTNGHEHRYDAFYAASTGPDVAAPVAEWVRDRLLAHVLPGLEAAGFPVLPYSFPRDEADPARGIFAAEPFTPRLSNGYAAVCNRPAVLIEAHAWRPYGRRVAATHAFLVQILEAVGRDPEALRAAVRAADAQAAATRGGDHDGRVPIRFAPDESSRPIVYRGVQVELRPSAIAGGDRVHYTGRPLDVPTALYDRIRVERDVAPAFAYIVPPQWAAVIERLALHGLPLRRLARPCTLAVESYRFEEVTFAAQPYEGRQLPRYRAVPVQEQRSFPAGSVVVPLAHARAKLAAGLLEPDAPDALVAWGLLNAIFEQKEYAEAYVLEPLAERMLAEDPALRAEFEARLAADPDFAGNPARRLGFFYERSPYRDPQRNLYPIARLLDAAALAALPLE